MTSLQAGQRALSLSANVIMASTTFIKDTGCTGILRLLLLGILLPSVLVSGQSSGVSTVASAAASTITTEATTTTSTTTSESTTTSTTTQPPSSTTAIATGSTATSTTIQPSPMTTTASTATTQSATSGVGSVAMTQSSTTMMVSGSTSSSSSMTSGSSTSTINSTGNMSGVNGTTMSNLTSMSMIYCPSFMCNYSDCYTMYTSQNATSCAAGAYCQLLRQMDMCYIVSCSASCADSCFKASQTNCSVDCCNSTGCLNSSFASMMITTTVIATTTTTTPVPKTTAISPQTTANKGNKCHSGVCTGTDCYTDFRKSALQTCSSSQPHCQLTKETVNTNLQWTAGCTTNCSTKTPCKASTQPPCHLECCNATMTSCLWLNGTLNVPSFATRGPHLNTELIASLLCLLAITLLL
ncbi:integumentary mucin C.1 [Siniperca chuatsi]|uniref:integumentary mucin C.1 n=1 Tax=Siniperca chuatsi TaxID=119488 RepID=UPI001CE173DE|nr:integumentary mucin C.1 [Siniperca chuatsi]